MINQNSTSSSFTESSSSEKHNASTFTSTSISDTGTDLGTNRTNRQESTLVHQILLSTLLSLGILVTAVIAITTYFYLKKKKKTSITIPTNTGISDTTEIPLRLASPPQGGVSSMESFLNNVERENPVRFSPQQLARITKDLTFKLGLGGSGVVYKGELENGVPVAVKVLRKGKNFRQHFMAEVDIIERTSHINLIKLYGYCYDQSMKALIYEYMENGSLNRFLYSRKKIDWGKLHEIAIGIAKGIAYLHEDCHDNIIHYDIKPGNVLLDAKLVPKIADFGLAKLLCNSEEISNCVSKTSTFRGTTGYAAPEFYEKGNIAVTEKCDVYSFGIMLFEIVGRRRNFDDQASETFNYLSRFTWEMYANKKLSELLLRCGIEERNKEKAERTAMVALWCIQYVPEKRPKMSQVVKMLEGGMEIGPPPYPFQLAPESSWASTESKI